MSYTCVVIAWTILASGIFIVVLRWLYILHSFVDQTKNQRIQEFKLKSLEMRKSRFINPGEYSNMLWRDSPQVGENIPKKKKEDKIIKAQVKAFMEDKDHEIILMDDIPATEGKDHLD